MFNVMCRVSGGVMGTRTALLKKSGEVQVFATREAADREAEILNFMKNGPRATATFLYWTIDASDLPPLGAPWMLDPPAREAK